MKTEINFLRDLEEDLERAAHDVPAPKHPSRSFVPTGRRAIALATVGVLIVAGGLGYVLRSGSRSTITTLPKDLRTQARARPGPVGPAHPNMDAARPAGGSAVTQQGERASGLPLIGPQIVKTARLGLTVKKGRFDDAFQQASLVASRFGGFVDSSSTEGADSKYGTLDIRVPSASFERALADLRALGTVTSESVSGQDVTSQYVDLQARIRTWQAQEDVLLKLMAKSTTVGDTLRVQQNLQDVQLEIERLKGQLQVLQDQTDNGTISVSLREAGAPVKEQAKASSWLPDFGKAWHDTVRGFFGVVFAVLVGLGYLVPLGLLLVGLWLGVRQVRLRASA